MNINLFKIQVLKSSPKISKSEVQENLSDALMEAVKDPTYIMLFLGFLKSVKYKFMNFGHSLESSLELL